MKCCPNGDKVTANRHHALLIKQPECQQTRDGDNQFPISVAERMGIEVSVPHLGRDDEAGAVHPCLLEGYSI